MVINLRKLREEAGMSQSALAEAVGLSQQSINKYECSNVEPEIGTLIRIATILNTSVDYLIGRSTQRYPESERPAVTKPCSEDTIAELYSYLSREQQECINKLFDVFLPQPPKD